MPQAVVFHALDGNVRKDAWSCPAESETSTRYGLDLHVATQDRQQKL